MERFEGKVEVSKEELGVGSWGLEIGRGGIIELKDMP